FFHEEGRFCAMVLFPVRIDLFWRRQATSLPSDLAELKCFPPPEGTGWRVFCFAVYPAKRPEMWRVRQVVRQRSAKPLSAVRFRHAPPNFSLASFGSPQASHNRY